MNLNIIKAVLSGFTLMLLAACASNYPPVYKVDTDKDGIWDHLDPNPKGKPNILLIVLDDLGFNDLGINNGNTNIDTPTMDQFARDGVRFTRHYATAVCSPGRAALLTGLYPERLGYLPNGRGISADIVTMPERLQEEGYTNWHIGKWHIGFRQRTAWPDHQGFDHWFGFLNQSLLAGVELAGEIQMSKPRYEDPYLQSDTAPGQHYTGHLQTILTDKTINVISDLQEAQAPWFVNLWYYAPHAPVTPSEEFAALYPDTEAGRYRALVNQLDSDIARITAHLDAIEASDNTIIVIVSDNGGTNISVDSNAPYLGKKTTFSEGGLRTPLLIRWPDAALNAQVVDDIIAIQDIYPTLLDAIDVIVPAGLDGASFYPSIAGLEPAPQKDLFWEMMAGQSYGVLTADGRWRLHQPLPYYGFPVSPRIYDFDVDPTATVHEVPTPAAQLTLMNASYSTWFHDVHRVQTSFVPTRNGGGVLSGTDFLRTPGFGWYTFGIGVPDELHGQIASQADIWNMSRAGDTVTANYGEVALSGDITNSNECHSVVVSGKFKRRSAHYGKGAKIFLTLYIDGVAVDSAEAQTTLKVADPTVPTIIGNPEASSGNGIIQPPIVLNTKLDETTKPWSVASFSAEVCAS